MRASVGSSLEQLELALVRAKDGPAEWQELLLERWARWAQTQLSPVSSCLDHSQPLSSLQKWG
jgi:hypothetical protein